MLVLIILEKSSARLLLAVHDYETGGDELRAVRHNFPKSSRAFAALTRFGHIEESCLETVCWV